MNIWAQPIDPLHSLLLSGLAAAVPLAVLLILMGGLRKAGWIAAAWGLIGALALSVIIWKMPADLALWSAAYGLIFSLSPILWLLFTALWLYNLTVETGKFELLRRWMAIHASGDARIQAILVAFCFGALLEGMIGFGAPVAIAAFLLVGLGFSARKAVIVSLLANTAPVAFGSLGIPIVALAGVTGLDLSDLSAMVGRQLPFMSLILPAYLVLVVDGRKGLRETWPAALVGGASYALSQFVVSNYWGPYAADIVAAIASITCLMALLRFWRPTSEGKGEKQSAPGDYSLSRVEVLAAWAPWIILAVVMVVWSSLDLFGVGAIKMTIPGIHNGVFITLYERPYPAVYTFQPLAAGTAVLGTAVVTALMFRAGPQLFFRSAAKTLHQLRLPALTVCLIVSLAYLYNYSGMAYTLGAALSGLGTAFPFVSAFLGWVACFLSGSDTASNLLFGNLQVAVGHQIGVNPVLLASTNTSGAVTGKMISPQNIAVGVTTVGLAGQEGHILRSTFWHSLVLATGLGLLSFVQAYWIKWMIP